MRPVSATFPVRVGGHVLQLQVVVTTPEQQRGLMERRDLPADGGMIFVYPLPQRMSFWMRNTPTPLDLACFDAEGRLGEVLPLHPFDETAVVSSKDHYTLALEVHQGWFARKGLVPGETRIDHADVAAALAARGFPPSRYGLHPAAPAK